MPRCVVEPRTRAEPAVVVTHPGPGRAATVLHSAGPDAPNAVLTRSRLLEAGWQLRHLPADPVALAALVEVQHPVVQRAVRKILAERLEATPWVG